MLRQQNGVVTPHLGYPSVDPALGGYPTKFFFIIFTWNFVEFGQKKLWGRGRFTKINCDDIFFGQNFQFVVAMNRPPLLGVNVKVRVEPLWRQVFQLSTDQTS